MDKWISGSLLQILRLEIKSVMGYHKLSELKVWQKARLFRKAISSLTKTLPKEEKYKLVDQIIRSSRSVTANISEGHGRFHYQENIQYCRMSRGSLIETYDHLTVALDETYITREVFEKLKIDLEEIEKMLNGYITYLVKQKNNGK